MIDDTLMLRISLHNIKELSRPEKIMRIYQAALADEHRDMNFERAQQSQFLALTAHCRQAPAAEPRVEEHQCLLYLRAKMMVNANVVLSFPKEIFGMMVQSGASDVDDVGGNMQHDVFNQIVVIADHAIAFDMNDVDSVVFFSVVNLAPEKRHAVPIHHKKASGARIHVLQRPLLSSEAARSSVTVSASPSSTQLGLLPLIKRIVEYLPKLFGWAVVSQGSMHAVKGASGGMALLVGTSPRTSVGSLTRGPGSQCGGAPQCGW